MRPPARNVSAETITHADATAVAILDVPYLEIMHTTPAEVAEKVGIARAHAERYRQSRIDDASEANETNPGARSAATPSSRRNDPRPLTETTGDGVRIRLADGSTGEVRHCPHCGGAISLSPSRSRSRGRGTPTTRQGVS